MARLGLLVLTFMLCTSSAYCKAYKGLFIMTFGTKSHLNFFGEVTKALAQHGHQITFVSPHGINLKDKNVNVITIEGNDIATSFGNAFALSNVQLLQLMTELVPQFCINVLTNPQVAEALKQDYDYIILSLFATECFLGHIYEKKIPFIYANPNVLLPPYNMRLGSPDFSSITPNKYVDLTYPMSFSGRALNLVVNLFVTFFTDMASIRADSLCREKNLWSSEIPPVMELQNEASLAIINGIRALEVPVKSTPPSVIYAGGIHIQKPKPIPEDMKAWLDGSGENGFILFSLGTGARPEDMKPEHLQSILNVFKTLDQRVIWKWNAKEIENLPPNVKLWPWLPQQDILAHPNIRLFITHGGLFSSQEASYFGIPLLGMPIFGDQMSNVAEFEAEGWGCRLLWENVNEQTFRAAVLDAMTSTSVREKVQLRSQLMKDWPTKPSEEVVYWVEYVVRHKGAKHLQSPLVHMTWYEIYNIDAWVFIISILVALLIVVFHSLKFLFNFVKRKLFKKKRD